MPYLKLQTNQSLSEEEETGLCKIVSDCVAQTLGKSERYVMVSVESGVNMTFAASDEPCAFVELKSIGLATHQTTDLSASICDMLQTNIGVSAERTYIEFSDAEPPMWGWDRKTFAR